MKLVLFALVAVSLLTTNAFAADCDSLPKWKDLKEALTKSRQQDNGGFNLDMWATVVNRDGEVCAVAFTGNDRGDQWPGSRLISAQKANTANAFSLPKLALSTANLFSPTQPGQSLFGLQASNPVNPEAAYDGSPKKYGQDNDPLVGKKIGGINVFGGGLALYNEKHELVGALGVSGDSSCADHNIAWRTRNTLKLDYVPAGVSPEKDDNIIFLKGAEKPNGFKHPTCGNKENKIKLPPVAAKVETKAEVKK